MKDDKGRQLLIYKDRQLTQEVTDHTLDFGIVSAGEKETFTFWVKNITYAYLRKLQFFVDHAEVEVIEAPEELKSQESARIIFEWKPSITLKEGLRAIIRVTGEELWG